MADNYPIPYDSETRADFLERIAEFTLSDEHHGDGAYWYDRDLLQHFSIGETELEMVHEMASDIRNRRRFLGAYR